MTRFIVALAVACSSSLGSAATIQLDPSYASDPDYIHVTVTRIAVGPGTPPPITELYWYEDLAAAPVAVPGNEFYLPRSQPVFYLEQYPWYVSQPDPVQYSWFGPLSRLDLTPEINNDSIALETAGVQWFAGNPMFTWWAPRSILSSGYFPVPEPGAWLLAVCGLGVCGWRFRR